MACRKARLRPDRLIAPCLSPEFPARSSIAPRHSRSAFRRKIGRQWRNRNGFLEILDLVRQKTHQDFSLYKTGTLERRIERRMAMAGIADAARYVERLRSDPAELDSLGHDLLINVTEFFRDSAAFEAIAASVIPDMVSEQPLDRPLRIWVPGCSTGEEVYSLTMLFLEAIKASKRNIKLQVFASDVDARSVAFARAGLYGPETADRVAGTRLARFLSKEGTGYRVVRDLRETVVFTVQDLLADPPFSRLDLISCRNLLIYLQPSAKSKSFRCFISLCVREACFFLAGPRRLANSRSASNRSTKSKGSTAISAPAVLAKSIFVRAPR